MLPLREEDLAIVVGIRGSGKTYFVRENVFRKHDRVVAWDPKGDFKGAHTHIVTLAEYAKLGKLFGSTLPFKIVVTPGKFMEDKEQAEEIRDFAKLSEAILTDATIIIEECGIYEQNKRAQAGINYIATQSRHWGCANVLVGQRMIHIPATARGQASLVVCFRQKSELDLAAAKPYFGKHTAALPEMPRYQYKLWAEDLEFKA